MITVHGLDDFTAELNEAVKNLLPEEISTVQKKIVFDLLGKIVKRTPVGNPDLWKGPAPDGYVGGRARANWQVQVGGEPGEDELDKVDEDGAVTIGLGEAEALTAEPFTVIWIFNNVPYIVRLEAGHSTQAAPGEMIALSVEEVTSVFGG